MKENIKYKKVFIVLIGYELSIINYFSYLFLISNFQIFIYIVLQRNLYFIILAFE